MGILYHYSPKNVVSLDRITCKRIDKIKNNYVVNNYVEVIPVILLE